MSFDPFRISVGLIRIMLDLDILFPRCDRSVAEVQLKSSHRGKRTKSDSERFLAFVPSSQVYPGPSSSGDFLVKFIFQAF